jgi:hypothetical protein
MYQYFHQAYYVQKYHSVKTFSKFNLKFLETEAKSIYMTAHSRSIKNDGVY